MPVYRIEIAQRNEQTNTARNNQLTVQLREAGLDGIESIRSSRLFLLEGQLTRVEAEEMASTLLVDPVTELANILDNDEQVSQPDSGVSVEVYPKPGVMDPVAQSTLSEVRAEGHPVDLVRTARRYILQGRMRQDRILSAVSRVLANDCIEHAILGTAGVEPAPKPPIFDFELRHVPIRDLDEAGLRGLSRDGHLFLSLEEMHAVQHHFRELKRDPTDLELETLAQTWSEHCVHKTLKSEITYHGAPMGTNASENVEIHYDNLLKDTIARATDELIAEGRGPECLSVFVDNAGVISFDEQYGLAFKVETHNHPSAIEPYGGAATGIGGCIRDVMGCGLGARPIANTDVFCVAPSDWPTDKLPRGILHPRRVLRGVVGGVSDYGNRMGIPTVNGSVYFDPRFLGNPLVYCGCLGLIPRDMVEKAARPDDLIVVIGGQTGRDGIHGATFSSAELTDTHADEFSHAVQIGNAITEKRCLDAILQARDHESGCLYTALTDCGAGGLSSAVGEMGEQVGAKVDLENVPLKYAGLRYDEIWISEAQERMVLAVPPESIDQFMEIMRGEEVEATIIGTFGSEDQNTPRLIVRYAGTTVGEIDMRFLHNGLPKRKQRAEWQPAASQTPSKSDSDNVLKSLESLLRSPNIASKGWIIRQYDHEVQGGSVVKPLGGPGAGPGDAAVLRPRLDSNRGIALGSGNAAHISDLDPYWTAVASIDEAIRNIVAVGGDPTRTAILDNFCWGNCDDPKQLGTLVRACHGCYDAAKAYGTPFVSGKDSLNNDYALHAEDVESLLAVMRDYAERETRDYPDAQNVYEAAAERIRDTNRLSIPGTLLISALSLIDDINNCVTSDLKQTDGELFLVGGLPQIDYPLSEAAEVHLAIADAIKQRLIAACHDSSDGGWLTALAEMAIAGNRGVNASGTDVSWGPFDECCAAYVVEATDGPGLKQYCAQRQVRCRRLGQVSDGQQFTWEDQVVELATLRAAWGA